MKANYGVLNDVRNKIQEHQEAIWHHPFTCGNNSRHSPLVPLMMKHGDSFELILACEDCSWEQDVPEFIR